MDDISGILERLAVSQPAAPALHVPGRTSLTYADLGAQIRYVRERLSHWGVVRGDVVIGVIPPRPEMALACATIPAVATFVPLSSALTPDEYAELLTRLRPKLVIVSSGVGHPLRVAARRGGVAEVGLTGDLSAPAGRFTLDLTRQDQSFARAPSAQPDWAYVLTTSGTTGRPKLVPRSHRQLALFAESLGECYGLATSDVGCHLLPMHHSHGLDGALMVPLQLGASVVCLPESDIDGFFAALDDYQITWLTTVFTVHREILRRAPDFREAVARNRLRFMRVGSGRLEPDEIDRIERTFGAPLLMGFGMTEVRMITHDPLPPRMRKRESVGVPLCNQVAILSEAGEIRATGDVGEIVVRGPLVFDGYFDDAQATAAAFIDGWFRTGDLGRLDEDGYLYLVGRVKDLINRGGVKISPGEVDAAIAAIPGVRAAATFAIPHRSLGEEVVAAVVRDGDVAIEASDIIDQVRRRVGPNRAPRQVFFVDQLPRTDSGKVRRSELPRLLGLDKPGVAAPTESAREAQTPSGSPLEAAPARPWSSIEQEVADVWKRVLELDTIRLDDDFFLAGGDSLKAAELFAQLRRQYRVPLGLREIFDEAATVAGMARLIERARQRGADPGPASAGLVWIKAEGARPPLFAVPGGFGNPVGYIHLARLLDARQPLIGLESRGIDGTAAPIARMEHIAADNIARIRSIQPRGPYFLTGACFGGRVAYEIARQLEAAGESIGLLVMLDPSPPFFNDEGRPRGETAGAQQTTPGSHLRWFILRRIAMYAKTMMTLRGSARRAFFRQKIANFGGMIAQRDLFRGDRSEFHQYAVFLSNRRAGRAYVPGPFSGPTVLCITRGRQIERERKYRLDWLDLVPHVVAPIYVAGKDSGDMLNPPNVNELADLVNGWLEQAHAKALVQAGDRPGVPSHAE